MTAQGADTIYHNGRVITMWSACPLGEAIAIRGNRFLSVGPNEQVLQTASESTRKIDLQGRSVVPGLIDTHTHPILAALTERDGPMPRIRSIADLHSYLGQQAAILPSDRVIVATKVFPTRLKEHRYPTREELNAATGDRPAVVDSGYAAVLNTALLGRLSITRDTPQPPNGKIVKDPQGEPTGLVLGARELIAPLLDDGGPASFEDMLGALKGMQARYNRAGLTSVIDRSQGAEGFRAYQTLARRGELTVRTYITWVVSLEGNPKQVRERIKAVPLLTGWGDDWVRVGSLKAFLDGGILSGTAYLREPYGAHTAMYGYDDPTYRGALGAPRENIVEMARTANELGWQMTAHATGGGAVDLLLDAYEAANQERPISDRRFTVSHANFPDLRAIARAKELGVVFDCQPAWHYLDAPAIKDVFGPERMRHFQPYRSMFDVGVVVAGGSDHMAGFDPCESINPYAPFFGIWMAITRQTVDGSVMEPEQVISREEALRMWTWNGAYLSFEENTKGSIEPGKLADFAVISKDYLSCPADEIKNIEVLCTVVDGRVVYSSSSQCW